MASAAPASAVAPAAVQAAAQPAIAYTTYTLDYDDDKILIMRDNAIIHQFPIDEIQRAMGGAYASFEMMRQDQQTWNFLDAIKDGIKKAALKGLRIYPHANQTADLEARENAVIGRVTDNLIRRTWTKVRPGTKMGHIDVHTFFWESGLGREHFINILPNGLPVSITTIGTYIDPLSKPGVRWPPAGKSIVLTSELMNLFGFGDSVIKAKTTDATTKTFTYDMVVGCGGCNANICRIQRSNPSIRDSNMKYYKGNKTKNRILSGKVSQKEKVKYVVVKGWGDKIQVLLYFMYYHIQPKNRSTIMITNDMVVYALCITLNIPCTYTGSYVHRPIPGEENIAHQKGKSFYSIVEFNPGTPMENIVRARRNAIQKIYAENSIFIASIYALYQKPDTSISIQGEMKKFTQEFYQALINDMNILNIELRRTENDDMSGLSVDQIKQNIQDITKDYLIVPFIKIRGGRPVMLTARNAYTINGDRYKGHVITANPEDTFYEIGVKYRTFGATARMGQGGGRRGGGEVITPEEMKTFATSDHSPKWFTYTEEHLDHLPSLANGNEHIFEKSDDKITVDLQAMLDDSFNKAFDSLFMGQSEKDLENIRETVYTFYMYECEAEGGASYDIQPRDIERVIKQYGIRTTPYTKEELSESKQMLAMLAMPASLLKHSLYTPLKEPNQSRKKISNGRRSNLSGTVKRKSNYFSTPPPRQRLRSPHLFNRNNNGSDEEGIYTPPYNLQSPVRQMNILVNGGRRRTHKKTLNKRRKTRKTHKN
jgi:hypothetical protein